jgi:ubiquinone/menaquinone biosynthesis C-methylase UbiE
MSILSRNEIIDLYRKRARHYDVTANLYYLIGFREWAYRKKAIDSLGLQPGDTVVEIGCGTGLNIPLLRHVVGPGGKVIGVDLTDSMLQRARERVAANGWKNVELVQSDAASFVFPSDIDGALSTFALTLVPEFESVIRRGCSALKQGKRWVVLDFKLPLGILRPLAWVGIFLSRPFGVQRELAERHPWEAMERVLANTTVTDLYGGFSYIAAGERPSKGCG